MRAGPFYVVFAGVNGAGKSTLFHSDAWRMPDMPHVMPRVNPDEILREQGGNWADPSDQLTAGKAALRAVEEHLVARRSFNQETTLAGHHALHTVMRAHRLGYRVFLFYVGVADENIALRRIAHRVDIGGHDIDEAAVRRRYHTSLVNMSRALPYCEEVHVFDNTIAFKRIALWRRNTLAWWGASSEIGAWLTAAITDDELWRI